LLLPKAQWRRAWVTLTQANPWSSVITGSMASQTDLRLEALRSAPLDKWIALSEDESKIVAVGSTYEEAVKNSEIAGVSDPVLLKTPKVWLPLSV
jgi:hypothetical protein